MPEREIDNYVCCGCKGQMHEDSRKNLSGCLTILTGLLFARHVIRPARSSPGEGRAMSQYVTLCHGFSLRKPRKAPKLRKLQKFDPILKDAASFKINQSVQGVISPPRDVVLCIIRS
jgi:hypothetical protein